MWNLSLGKLSAEFLAMMQTCVEHFKLGNFVRQCDLVRPEFGGTTTDCSITGYTDKNMGFSATVTVLTWCHDQNSVAMPKVTLTFGQSSGDARYCTSFHQGVLEYDPEKGFVVREFTQLPDPNLA